MEIVIIVLLVASVTALLLLFFSKSASATLGKYADIAKIVSAVAALVGLALTIYLNLPSLRQKTEFTFQCEGSLLPGDCIYEVTEELAWGEYDLGEFQIVVTAHRGMDDVEGKILVRVLPSAGEPITVAHWDDFREQHLAARQVTLAPKNLFEYAGLPLEMPGIDPTANDPLSDRSGAFTIEVTTSDQRKLASTTVSVTHTPWYHTTQLADCSLQSGTSITAYVTVRNLGAPAEFNIVGILYDASDASTSTLSQDGDKGWWPAKSWKSIDVRGSRTEKPIGVDDTAAVTLVMPVPDSAERGHYILETFVTKRLPYLDFGSDSWIDSLEAWRPRDQPNYATVVLLAP